MSVSIDAVIHLTTLKDGSYLTGCCIPFMFYLFSQILFLSEKRVRDNFQNSLCQLLR